MRQKFRFDITGKRRIETLVSKHYGDRRDVSSLRPENSRCEGCRDTADNQAGRDPGNGVVGVIHAATLRVGCDTHPCSVAAAGPPHMPVPTQRVRVRRLFGVSILESARFTACSDRFRRASPHTDQ